MVCSQREDELGTNVGCSTYEYVCVVSVFGLEL